MKQVTLKCATSLDGKIALNNGQSRWITGPEARQAGHQLRAEHDAIMVGSGTVLADDPLLTVRLDGYTGPQPTRIIADGRLRTRPTHQLAKTARDVPVIIITQSGGGDDLRDMGVTVVRVDDMSPKTMINALTQHGITKLFIEGGAMLATSFLQAGLVTHLEWFRATVIIGGDGRDVFGPLGHETLQTLQGFTRAAQIPLGADLWERYKAS